MLQLNDEAEEVVKCPVCFDTKYEIMQCIIGHHICIQCKAQVHECPTCESPFKGTKSFLVQDVTEKLSNMKVCELQSNIEFFKAILKK